MNVFPFETQVIKKEREKGTTVPLFQLCVFFIIIILYFGFSAPIKLSFPFVSFAEYVTDSYVCLGGRGSEHGFFEKQLSLPWKTELFKNVLPVSSGNTCMHNTV